MSLESKVVWSEGMFLNPQHFQQQERFFERYVNGKCSAIEDFGWGLHEFDIDKQLLKLGRISIKSASGVFPDGTPFSFPDNDNAPSVFEVPVNTHNAIVYLAIPVKRQGTVDVISIDDKTQGMARYYSSEQEIRDITIDGGVNLPIQVGKLRIKILLDKQDLSGYTTIGIARISESREDKNVLLDEKYIPTCINCKATSVLSGFIIELLGLLHHRGEAIAGRLADVQRGGAAQVSDYMVLQLINRLEPLVVHLSNIYRLHPLKLYVELIQMVGELSTFVSKNKRPPVLPQYKHDNLQDSFEPLIALLRQCLAMVYEQTAISLNLVEKKYGIRVAEITDRSLLDSASFILAVKADMNEETLRSRFPAQLKIGPVERIRQLVNAAMPGIGIKPLSVAPRQIPFHTGYTYFKLEQQSEFWNELQNSGGIALHIGGDFPGLEIEFWAIRQ